MAQKRIVEVGIRRNKKRWTMTISGADPRMLNYLAGSVRACARIYSATIYGSDPLVGIEKDNSEAEDREVEKAEEGLKL